MKLESLFAENVFEFVLEVSRKIESANHRQPSVGERFFESWVVHDVEADTLISLKLMVLRGLLPASNRALTK